MDEERSVPRVDRIDLDDTYQVSQWTEICDVTEAELRAAVDAVGHRAADVKRHVRATKGMLPRH